MNIDLRPVVASVREASHRLRAGSATDTSVFALTATLLDAVAAEMVAADESNAEYRQAWTAAVLLARKILGEEVPS